MTPAWNLETSLDLEYVEHLETVGNDSERIYNQCITIT